MNICKRISTKFSLCFLAALFCCSAFFAIPSAALNTEQEPALRVGFFPLNGFYQKEADGRFTGYGVEYWQSIAAEAGLSYEYVEAESWPAALAMLDAGEIDVLAPAEETPERLAQYDFCGFPMGTEYGALLTLSTNESLVYEDYTAFNGRKVGCVASVVFMDSFLEYQEVHGFNTELVYYKDTPAMIAALNAGEVDAVMGNLMVKTDTMKVLGKFGAAPYYIMTSRGNAGLTETLDKAIESFNSCNPGYQADLAAYYFPDYVIEPLSRADLDFIASCPPITIGAPSDFLPQSYADKSGTLCGIDRRIMEQVSEISGLTFQFVALPSGSIDYQYLVDNNIQLICDVEGNVYNRTTSGLSLSYPYFSAGKVFIGESGRYYDMDSPLTVALATGSQTLATALSTLYPNYTFVPYATLSDCLAAIRAGEADVVLENRYVAEPLLSDPHYTDYILLPQEGLSAQYCLSVVSRTAETTFSDEDIARLLSILNKSIRQIPQSTIDEITSSEVLATRYQYDLGDFLYLYRVPIVIIVFAVAAIIGTLSAAVQIQLKSKRAVTESKNTLAHITNNINGGVVVLRLNEGLEITYANDGFLHLLGCTRDEFETKYHSSYLACVHPDDMHLMQEAVERPAGPDNHITMQLRISRTDGGYISTAFSGTLVEREDGSKELYCVIMDITEQQRITEQLRISQKRSELIMQKTANIFFDIDLVSGTISCSPKLQTQFGWTLPNKIHSMEQSTFMEMWHGTPDSIRTLHKSTHSMLAEHKDVSCTVQLTDAAGNAVWCLVSQYPIFSREGSISAVVGSILNVNEETLERMALEKKAQQDLLTGLLKKESFADLVMKHLNHAAAAEDALIFLDLDHFKQVNDVLGHLAGDRAIQDAAQKLRIIFSNYDLIARFGGDEFCIYVRDIPKETLCRKLDWMLEKLKATYGEGKQAVSVTCSIGVARTADLGTQYSVLLESADKALYQSKEAGRNRYTFAG